MTPIVLLHLVNDLRNMTHNVVPASSHSAFKFINVSFALVRRLIFGGLCQLEQLPWIEISLVYYMIGQSIVYWLCERPISSITSTMSFRIESSSRKSRCVFVASRILWLMVLVAAIRTSHVSLPTCNRKFHTM